jgi:hypothetical protein
VAGRNVGTFLQHARSGRGCSARASAGDRAVAAHGGLASLYRLHDDLGINASRYGFSVPLRTDCCGNAPT